MPQKNKLKIESVQVIKIEDTEFVFNYDAVKKIIDANPECSDLPVAIIIINGALRTGKSFFNNFVIRYLMKLDKNLVVFITGGASGLGEAALKYFLSFGCSVAIAD